MGTTQIVVTNMLMQDSGSAQEQPDSLLPVVIALIFVALVAWVVR